MTRRVNRLACLILCLSFAACSGGAKRGEKAGVNNSKKISISYDGNQTTWEQTSGLAFSLVKTLVSDVDSRFKEKARVHRIVLANYDLGQNDEQPEKYRRIEAPKQYRVEIQIEPEQSAQDEPLRVGTYTFKPEPYNRLSFVFISYYREGKDYSDGLQSSKFQGHVKITSVTDGWVEGVIDVTDGDEAVSGSFIARRGN